MLEGISVSNKNTLEITDVIIWKSIQKIFSASATIG